MEKITAYYVDPTTNTAETREITPELDTYYELLHCDTIDIVNRGFENTGRRFDIICDDEGLLKGDIKISAISSSFEPMLVGALLVIGQADDDGCETSLSPDDVFLLMCNTFRFGNCRMLGMMTY